jgi:hypothetical protein
MLRIRHCLDSCSQMALSLSASHTDRALLPRNNFISISDCLFLRTVKAAGCLPVIVHLEGEVGRLSWNAARNCRMPGTICVCVFVMFLYRVVVALLMSLSPEFGASLKCTNTAS